MNKQANKQTDEKKTDVWGWIKSKGDDKKVEEQECCCGGGCCGEEMSEKDDKDCECC